MVFDVRRDMFSLRDDRMHAKQRDVRHSFHRANLQSQHCLNRYERDKSMYFVDPKINKRALKELVVKQTNLSTNNQKMIK